ncbi:hypothetical protein ElyMa_004223500 [Elysia marginata]|uniref:Uncharacterized protein n=1 Tax=Elysia marginata TaxID=1093978 RepID=A0AAV4GNZ2_9GAST|nr:hypothetical protein ElyMa_004223500 [Elysia marginata]
MGIFSLKKKKVPTTTESSGGVQTNNLPHPQQTSALSTVRSNESTKSKVDAPSRRSSQLPPADSNRHLPASNSRRQSVAAAAARVYHDDPPQSEQQAGLVGPSDTSQRVWSHPQNQGQHWRQLWDERNEQSRFKLPGHVEPVEDPFRNFKRQNHEPAVPSSGQQSSAKAPYYLQPGITSQTPERFQDERVGHMTALSNQKQFKGEKAPGLQETQEMSSQRKGQSDQNNTFVHPTDEARTEEIKETKYQIREPSNQNITSLYSINDALAKEMKEPRYQGREPSNQNFTPPYSTDETLTKEVKETRYQGREPSNQNFTSPYSTDETLTKEVKETRCERRESSSQDITEVHSTVMQSIQFCLKSKKGPKMKRFNLDVNAVKEIADLFTASSNPCGPNTLSPERKCVCTDGSKRLDKNECFSESTHLRKSSKKCLDNGRTFEKENFFEQTPRLHCLGQLASVSCGRNLHKLMNRKFDDNLCDLPDRRSISSNETSSSDSYEQENVPRDPCEKTNRLSRIDNKLAYSQVFPDDFVNSMNGAIVSSSTIGEHGFIKDFCPDQYPDINTQQSPSVEDYRILNTIKQPDMFSQTRFQNRACASRRKKKKKKRHKVCEKSAEGCDFTFDAHGIFLRAKWPAQASTALSGDEPVVEKVCRGSVACTDSKGYGRVNNDRQCLCCCGNGRQQQPICERGPNEPDCHSVSCQRDTNKQLCRGSVACTNRTEKENNRGCCLNCRDGCRPKAVGGCEPTEPDYFCVPYQVDFRTNIVERTVRCCGEKPPVECEPPPKEYDISFNEWEPPLTKYKPPPQKYEPPPQKYELPPKKYDPPPEENEAKNGTHKSGYPEEESICPETKDSCQNTKPVCEPRECEDQPIDEVCAAMSPERKTEEKTRCFEQSPCMFRKFQTQPCESKTTCKPRFLSKSSETCKILKATKPCKEYKYSEPHKPCKQDESFEQCEYFETCKPSKESKAVEPCKPCKFSAPCKPSKRGKSSEACTSTKPEHQPKSCEPEKLYEPCESPGKPSENPTVDSYFADSEKPNDSEKSQEKNVPEQEKIDDDQETAGLENESVNTKEEKDEHPVPKSEHVDEDNGPSKPCIPPEEKLKKDPKTPNDYRSTITEEYGYPCCETEEGRECHGGSNESCQLCELDDRGPCFEDVYRYSNEEKPMPRPYPNSSRDLVNSYNRSSLANFTSGMVCNNLTLDKSKNVERQIPQKRAKRPRNANITLVVNKPKSCTSLTKMVSKKPRTYELSNQDIGNIKNPRCVLEDTCNGPLNLRTDDNVIAKSSDKTSAFEQGALDHTCYHPRPIGYQEINASLNTIKHGDDWPTDGCSENFGKLDNAMTVVNDIVKPFTFSEPIQKNRYPSPLDEDKTLLVNTKVVDTSGDTVDQSQTFEKSNCQNAEFDCLEGVPLFGSGKEEDRIFSFIPYEITPQFPFTNTPTKDNLKIQSENPSHVPKQNSKQAVQPSKTNGTFFSFIPLTPETKKKNFTPGKKNNIISQKPHNKKKSHSRTKSEPRTRRVPLINPKQALNPNKKPDTGPIKGNAIFVPNSPHSKPNKTLDPVTESQTLQVKQQQKLKREATFELVLPVIGNEADPTQARNIFASAPVGCVGIPDAGASQRGQVPGTTRETIWSVPVLPGASQVQERGKFEIDDKEKREEHDASPIYTLEQLSDLGKVSKLTSVFDSFKKKIGTLANACSSYETIRQAGKLECSERDIEPSGIECQTKLEKCSGTIKLSSDTQESKVVAHTLCDTSPIEKGDNSRAYKLATASIGDLFKEGRNNKSLNPGSTLASSSTEHSTHGPGKTAAHLFLKPNIISHLDFPPSGTENNRLANFTTCEMNETDEREDEELKDCCCVEAKSDVTREKDATCKDTNQKFQSSPGGRPDLKNKGRKRTKECTVFWPCRDPPERRDNNLCEKWEKTQNKGKNKSFYYSDPTRSPGNYQQCDHDFKASNEQICEKSRKDFCPCPEISDKCACTENSQLDKKRANNSLKSVSPNSNRCSKQNEKLTPKRDISIDDLCQAAARFISSVSPSHSGERKNLDSSKCLETKQPGMSISIEEIKRITIDHNEYYEDIKESTRKYENSKSGDKEIYLSFKKADGTQRPRQQKDDDCEQNNTLNLEVCTPPCSWKATTIKASTQKNDPQDPHISCRSRVCSEDCGDALSENKGKGSPERTKNKVEFNKAVCSHASRHLNKSDYILDKEEEECLRKTWKKKISDENFMIPQKKDKLHTEGNKLFFQQTASASSSNSNSDLLRKTNESKKNKIDLSNKSESIKATTDSLGRINRSQSQTESKHRRLQSSHEVSPATQRKPSPLLSPLTLSESSTDQDCSWACTECDDSPSPCVQCCSPQPHRSVDDCVGDVSSGEYIHESLLLTSSSSHSHSRVLGVDDEICLSDSLSRLCSGRSRSATSCGSGNVLKSLNQSKSSNKCPVTCCCSQCIDLYVKQKPDSDRPATNKPTLRDSPQETRDAGKTEGAEKQIDQTLRKVWHMLYSELPKQEQDYSCKKKRASRHFECGCEQQTLHNRKHRAQDCTACVPCTDGLKVRQKSLQQRHFMDQEHSKRGCCEPEMSDGDTRLPESAANCMRMRACKCIDHLSSGIQEHRSSQRVKRHNGKTYREQEISVPRTLRNRSTSRCYCEDPEKERGCSCTGRRSVKHCQCRVCDTCCQSLRCDRYPGDYTCEKRKRKENWKRMSLKQSPKSAEGSLCSLCERNCKCSAAIPNHPKQTRHRQRSLSDDKRLQKIMELCSGILSIYASTCEKVQKTDLDRAEHERSQSKDNLSSKSWQKENLKSAKAKKLRKKLKKMKNTPRSSSSSPLCSKRGKICENKSATFIPSDVLSDIGHKEKMSRAKKRRRSRSTSSTSSSSARCSSTSPRRKCVKRRSAKKKRRRRSKSNSPSSKSQSSSTYSGSDLQSSGSGSQSLEESSIPTFSKSRAKRRKTKRKQAHKKLKVRATQTVLDKAIENKRKITNALSSQTQRLLQLEQSIDHDIMKEVCFPTGLRRERLFGLRSPVNSEINTPRRGRLLPNEFNCRRRSSHDCAAHTSCSLSWTGRTNSFRTESYTVAGGREGPLLQTQGRRRYTSPFKRGSPQLSGHALSTRPCRKSPTCSRYFRKHGCFYNYSRLASPCHARRQVYYSPRKERTTKVGVSSHASHKRRGPLKEQSVDVSSQTSAENLMKNLPRAISSSRDGKMNKNQCESNLEVHSNISDSQILKHDHREQLQTETAPKRPSLPTMAFDQHEPETKIPPRTSSLPQPKMFEQPEPKTKMNSEIPSLRLHTNDERESVTNIISRKPSLQSPTFDYHEIVSTPIQDYENDTKELPTTLSPNYFEIEKDTTQNSHGSKCYGLHSKYGVLRRCPEDVILLKRSRIPSVMKQTRQRKKLLELGKAYAIHKERGAYHQSKDIDTAMANLSEGEVCIDKGKKYGIRILNVKPLTKSLCRTNNHSPSDAPKSTCSIQAHSVINKENHSFVDIEHALDVDEIDTRKSTQKNIRKTFKTSNNVDKTDPYEAAMPCFETPKHCQGKDVANLTCGSPGEHEEIRIVETKEETAGINQNDCQVVDLTLEET